jgi:NADH dehydrogenase [ubiquinone] 1 alpha subcomplex assembly factor 7
VTVAGPERLDRFMGRANAAYYATRDPFADFTTAPEISQVFGEILGAWAAVVWQSMNRPDPVILAEAGPGRGTLMADALRLVGQVAPDFGRALRLHFVESSPRLREAQAAAVLREAHWHERIERLPDGPLILLANEFLDALPVRQFRRVDAGWLEHHVGHGGSSWLRSGPPPGPAGRRAVPEGGCVETCEPALEIVQWLARRLCQGGGAALLLDYGPGAPGYGDTLQALKNGAPFDPFGPAGEADLTAHVDFPALLDAARGASAEIHAYGPVTQGQFLRRLGVFARVEQLIKAQPAGQGGALALAVHRLTDPAQMGTLFKAIVLCHPSLAIPPGFEEIAA